MSEKPALKIVIKPESSGAKAAALFAYWRKDGKLRGSMDGNVEQIAVKFKDGSVMRVKRKENGYPDHYINAYEEAAHDAKFAGPSKPRVGTNDAAGDFGDDFVDDSIPF